MIPKIVITAGLMVAQVAMGMAQRIKGPRLETLKTTTADYGTPIPRFWGKRRFECPIIWAEDLREDRNTSKGKTGKYEEYKYYGTWAVLIADHEIDAITKIKFDDHLVYQASDAGPISNAVMFRNGTGVKLRRGRNMRIYLGTETQDIDPRMEAWCEDRYGADSCPAYRGSAYIVFEDLPLEKFGNRIPLITVEAVKSKDSAYPYEVKTDTFRLSRFTYNQDQTRFILDTGTESEIWDVATRTKLLDCNPSGAYPSFDSSGAIWATTGFLGSEVWRSNSDGAGSILVATTPTDVFSDWVFCFGAGVYLRPYNAAANYFLEVVADEVVATTLTFSPNTYFQDMEGNVWAVGASTTNVYFWSRTGGAFTVTSPTSNSTAYAMDNGEGGFFVRHGDYLLLIDKETRALTASQSVNTNLTSSFSAFRNVTRGSESMWFQGGLATAQEYSTTTLALLQSVNLNNWRSRDVDDMVYDPINHALITVPQFADEMDWRYLNRVDSAGMTLADVVDDVSGWCGLADADTSALTQAIAGYSVTHGSGKDMIAPLLDIHDVDARPHDFGVQFVNRGSSPTGTKLTEEFVRDEARYTVTVQQDTDLPRRITINFADDNFEQQTNTVISQRPLDAVDSNREETIDLTTYVAVPDDAQQLSDRRFRRIWNERERTSLGLTARELAMEPGDVTTISLDGTTRTARLDKMTISGGTIRCEFVRDEPSLHTLNGATGAEMGGRDPEVIYIPADTKGFVKDIPLLRDSHSNAVPQFYFGAGKYANGPWPGANFYTVDADGDDFTEWNSVNSGDVAAWGYTLEALATANPWLWDRGNEVNVNVVGGIPVSVTETEIDADPMLNLALIGDELVQFTTATLESDGSYTFSGFKRGRRGTEWACSTHVEGEDFVIVSTFNREGYDLSEVGTDFTFRAQTLGRDPASAPDIDITPAGATLKPYAPGRLKAYYNGTDLVCTIYRRTRVGGAWTGGTTIPLSEASEEYEVEVYNGATLKRTITVTGTTSFTYTAAMAVTDGITLPTPPTFKVYQMSDAVGRGFQLAA